MRGAAIALVLVLVYGLGIGVTHGLYKRWKPLPPCGAVTSGQLACNLRNGDLRAAYVMLSLFWPIGLPVVVAEHAVESLSWPLRATTGDGTLEPSESEAAR